MLRSEDTGAAAVRLCDVIVFTIAAWYAEPKLETKMQVIKWIAPAAAALTLALLSRAANAAVYDITANETSAFSPEAISIDLDTAGAVASNGQTFFLDTTVKIDGVLQPSGVYTTTTNNIGGSSFFFVDTDTPHSKAFYSGSGESTVFNAGGYIIADGATDGEAKR